MLPTNTTLGVIQQPIILTAELLQKPQIIPLPTESTSDVMNWFDTTYYAGVGINIFDTVLGNDMTKTDAFTIGANTGSLVAVIFWLYKFASTGDLSPVPGL